MQTQANAPTYKDDGVLVCPTIPNLRLQTPPTFNGALVGPTTYAIAIVLGGGSAWDALGAVYAWDETSVAADNNSTVIVPSNAQVGGNPGRWRRVGGVL